MQQKIVIQLPLDEENSGSKAMTIASKTKGVTNVEVVRDKNHLVVIGEGVDSVKLANSLRKKFSFAHIVIVRSIFAEDSSFRQNEFQLRTFYNYNYPTMSQYSAHPVHDSYPPSCSIL